MSGEILGNWAEYVKFEASGQLVESDINHFALGDQTFHLCE